MSIQGFSLPSENSFIFYEIKNKEGEVKAYIIGTNHFIRPNDVGLNKRIIEAIKNSAKVLMELPPSSRDGLESKNLNDYIIKDFKSKPSHLADTELKKLNNCIKLLENKLKREVPAEELNKISYKAEELTHPKDKLMFYLAILGNVKNLKNISLDDYLAFLSIQDRANNFTLERIETIDVMEKISTVFPESKEHPEVSDDDIEKILTISPDSNEIGKMEENLYNAWTSGNAEKLKELYAADSIPEEFQKLNQARNEEIAAKIINVVSGRENSVFIFGTAHLLDSHTHTVLQLLENHFLNNGEGWNIQQIK